LGSPLNLETALPCRRQPVADSGVLGELDCTKQTPTSPPVRRCATLSRLASRFHGAGSVMPVANYWPLA
jgi:hypothetical protein